LTSHQYAESQSAATPAQSATSACALALRFASRHSLKQPTSKKRAPAQSDRMLSDLLLVTRVLVLHTHFSLSMLDFAFEADGSACKPFFFAFTLASKYCLYVVLLCKTTAPRFYEKQTCRALALPEQDHGDVATLQHKQQIQTLTQINKQHHAYLKPKM
jgi:hypothetical protein